VAKLVQFLSSRVPHSTQFRRVANSYFLLVMIIQRTGLSCLFLYSVTWLAKAFLNVHDWLIGVGVA